MTALQRHGIVVALGGSGLMAALGAGIAVRDWDLTTDADVADVLDALADANLAAEASAAGDGIFASRARFRLDGGGRPIDLIVGFAVRQGDLRVELPTRVSGEWHSVPLGDPTVWARAYQLMGRPDAAAHLGRMLSRRRP